MGLCREARVVACHAGVGTIMTARAVGKTPLVIPRLSRHDEHVDDHQLQIAIEFASHDLIVMLRDDANVEAALELTSAPRTMAQRTGALRRAIAEAVG